jgi:methyltransferase-like protein
MYWIMDKIAHNHEATKRNDQDQIKHIPAEWLKTPGIDSFGFYSTFSHFRESTYEKLAAKYAYMAQLAHQAGKKMLLPAHPGHDNSRFNETPYVMDRRDGQTLRDYLKAAVDAKADFVMVTSWNEWPETTIVEPSSTWKDPYQYLKILAEWKGVTFEPPAAPTNRPGNSKERAP